MTDAERARLADLRDYRARGILREDLSPADVDLLFTALDEAAAQHVALVALYDQYVLNGFVPYLVLEQARLVVHPPVATMLGQPIGLDDLDRISKDGP